MAFNSTIRYIDAVLSIDSCYFHNYVNSIYYSELEKKPTYSKISVSYLDILQEKDNYGALTTKLYDKYDNFYFSIVNLLNLCSNRLSLPAY